MYQAFSSNRSLYIPALDFTTSELEFNFFWGLTFDAPNSPICWRKSSDQNRQPGTLLSLSVGEGQDPGAETRNEKRETRDTSTLTAIRGLPQPALNTNFPRRKKIGAQRRLLAPENVLHTASHVIIAGPAHCLLG